MSDMLDNILSQNILNLTLDEAFLPSRPQLKAPGPRLNRSASYFSASSPSHSSASSHHSLSTEHVNNEEDGGSIWPSDIWSQVATSKYQKQPFRPDRSMSLTESSSTLFSSPSLLKGLEPSSSSSSSSVAPPPGFPPLSALQNQTTMTILPSNRYKTELCRGYQENGVCKYGSKCQFAHGVDELRGLYRHPKYKTEPCRTFYNFGYCPYGPRCHFIHENKVSDTPVVGGKFPAQRQQTAACAAGQNPRQPLRQSVSFAGFIGSSHSSPPPSLPPSTFNDLNLGFSRAPSVSPPPADLLSPAFGDSMQREASAAALQFQRQSRASTGDIHNIPRIVEPKPSCCRCCHRNSFPALNSNNNNRVLAVMDDSHHQEDVGLFTAPPSHGGYMKAPGLQRFSSEDSLEDSYSSCSGGSSGSESPTFDGSANKRLTVFARLSLSD